MTLAVKNGLFAFYWIVEHSKYLTFMDKRVHSRRDANLEKRKKIKQSLKYALNKKTGIQNMFNVVGNEALSF